MLEIKVHLNSPVEKILDFKCCHMLDQNLEILIRNRGQETVRVPGTCELVGPLGRLRLDCLYPPGGHVIPPGDIVAFYGSFPESLFDPYESVVFRDAEGREHSASLRPDP